MGLNRLLGDLAHNLDSATVGSYQGKSSFGTIAYSSLSGTPSVVFDSSLSSQFIDSAYIQARQLPGSSGLDSASAISVVDSDYINLRIGGGGSGFFVYEFETTAGQTAIKDSDLNGNLMAYQENGILVFKNGVLLLDSDDYTATDGSVVTLTSAAAAGSNITISKYVLGSGGGATFSWGGDRGLLMGGMATGLSYQSGIRYIDITTPGNASTFGSLTGSIGSAGGFGDGTYACAAGGSQNSTTNGINVIQYVTVATTANAQDFGDLTSVLRAKPAGAGDGTKGLVFGGYNGSNHVNTIQYVTVSSPGNATDFGDMSYTAYEVGATNDATYALNAGGFGSSRYNNIEYVTVATPGNSTDFGDLNNTLNGAAGFSSATIGVFAGGKIDAGGGTSLNNIDYVTIATPGNATDFGDLNAAGVGEATSSNGTYGIVKNSGYGTAIDYVTIATPGNATDFGDTEQWTNSAGASGSPS